MKTEHEDRLDDLLRSRTAQTPPPGFTDAVMRRLEPRRVPEPAFSAIADNGLYLGLSVAAAGVYLLARVEGMTAMFSHNPDAGGALIAAVAFSITWALTKKGSETEAL